jgi:hypothetical protein
MPPPWERDGISPSVRDGPARNLYYAARSWSLSLIGRSTHRSFARRVAKISTDDVALPPLERLKELRDEDARARVMAFYVACIVTEPAGTGRTFSTL